MKFALASDLHLHYGGILLENTEQAKVLVLAGDIYEACELPEYALEEHYVNKFFEKCSQEFENVIWIAGNHEFYGSDINNARYHMRRWTDEHPRLKNVKFIEKETVTIDGVHFHGTTLWTDMKKRDPLIMHQISRGLNDYNYIEKNTRNLTTDDVCDEFDQSFAWLNSVLIPGEKNVVITHHQPSEYSIDPRFIMDPLNYAYFTELSEFIFDRPEIKYWCAGHTHRKLYYPLGETMVICNPRGYHGYEKIASEFKLEFYDV